MLKTIKVPSANRNTVGRAHIHWQVSYNADKSVAQVEEQWKHCPLCTLPYPCNHVDAHQHAHNILERWKTYPSNPGSPLCVEFEASGFCSSFATRARCRFHHQIKELPIPFKRCKVCTLPVEKRCYVHNPPFGKKLAKSDQAIVIDGSDFDGRFAAGEIVAVASTSAQGYVYGLVVEASRKVRMYTVCTHIDKDGRFSKNTGQKSLGKLHTAEFRGWKRLQCVMDLLGTNHATLDAADAAEAAAATDANVEDVWNFDFVKVAQVTQVADEESDED